MHLTRLEVRDFRILENASLVPHERLNFVTGGNGAGKTSVLEAVHVLGTGRSFRSREVGTLVRWGCSALSVFGEALDQEGRSRRLGIVKGGSETRVRVDGAEAGGAGALARLLPLAVFGPESVELIDGPPEHRRSLMDWALFHVEREYGETLVKYRRALRQRNALLRAGGSRQEAESWDRALSVEGERVDRFRSSYADCVLPYVRNAHSSLSPSDLELQYRRGWPSREALGHALSRGWTTDTTRGWTGSGPHLADLVIKAGARSARDTLSRGEKKTLAAALILGHLEYLISASVPAPVLLVDDFASELDEQARSWFLTYILATACQSFLTLLDSRMVGSLACPDHTMFHVERGTLRQLV